MFAYISILPNKMNFSNQILGSSLSLPAYGREGQGQHLFSWRRISQGEILNSAAAEKRGRAKIHSPQPPFFLPARASGFIPAARSAAISRSFVQKRFELRSVIATNLNFFQIQRRFVARSPRLRRVSLRKKLCISELNRKVGQIQIQFFGKANGGSACEARNKQSLFPIFSFPPKAEHKASFLIPRFCAIGAMAKGDIINFKEQTI